VDLLMVRDQQEAPPFPEIPCLPHGHAETPPPLLRQCGNTCVSLGAPSCVSVPCLPCNPWPPKPSAAPTRRTEPPAL